MSLRTNLTLATIASLGFATVCAVCSAQLDREPPRSGQIVAAAKPTPLDEPVTTGSIIPTPPAAKVARLARIEPRIEPKPEPKKVAKPKPEPALDSDRLAALLAEPTVMKPKR